MTRRDTFEALVHRGVEHAEFRTDDVRLTTALVLNMTQSLSTLAPTVHGLSHQQIGGLADAEDQSNQRKQQIVGMHGCRQRTLAQMASDPEGIDRGIERLQHIAAPQRQGKPQQGAAYRCMGQWLVH